MTTDQRLEIVVDEASRAGVDALDVSDDGTTWRSTQLRPNRLVDLGQDPKTARLRSRRGRKELKLTLGDVASS